MKNIISIISLSILSLSYSSGQNIKLNKANLAEGRAYMTETKLQGKDVLKVVMDSTVKLFDEATFVKLKDYNFTDGTIEVNVLSKFLPNAPEWARGFIGVAFRINDDNSRFEEIYIRPSNGRATDQVRRNHSIQYYAYPDHKFDKLRKTDPEKYESYADMEMNKWIRMKIVVKGQAARLYLDNNTQPSIVVTDMKHGASSSGSIGLWVGPGTEGYFSDLKISK